MYKVVIIHDENIRRYAVVNSRTKELQSQWMKYLDAVLTARDLNRSLKPFMKAS